MGGTQHAASRLRQIRKSAAGIEKARRSLRTSSFKVKVCWVVHSERELLQPGRFADRECQKFAQPEFLHLRGELQHLRLPSSHTLSNQCRRRVRYCWPREPTESIRRRRCDATTDTCWRLRYRQ